MANLLAQTSGGLLTGLGFDGQAASSHGLLTMLSIPVPPPPGEVKDTGGGRRMRLLRVPAGRPLVEDDNEVLLILKHIWGVLG